MILERESLTLVPFLFLQLHQNVVRYLFFFHLGLDGKDFHKTFPAHHIGLGIIDFFLRKLFIVQCPEKRGLDQAARIRKIFI